MLLILIQLFKISYFRHVNLFAIFLREIERENRRNHYSCLFENSWILISLRNRKRNHILRTKFTKRDITDSLYYNIEREILCITLFEKDLLNFESITGKSKVIDPFAFGFSSHMRNKGEGRKVREMKMREFFIPNFHARNHKARRTHNVSTSLTYRKYAKKPKNGPTHRQKKFKKTKIYIFLGK